MNIEKRKKLRAFILADVEECTREILGLTDAQAYKLFDPNAYAWEKGNYLALNAAQDNRDFVGAAQAAADEIDRLIALDEINWDDAGEDDEESDQEISVSSRTGLTAVA